VHPAGVDGDPMVGLARKNGKSGLHHDLHHDFHLDLFLQFIIQVNKRIFLCVTVESADLFKDKEG
jgi:hypothetical protein